MVRGRVGKGARQGCRATSPYLPEPADIAIHPAWNSPIWARSAPALPNRMITPKEVLGLGWEVWEDSRGLPKCGGGFQIKLLSGQSRRQSPAGPDVVPPGHLPVSKQPELVCLGGGRALNRHLGPRNERYRPKPPVSGGPQKKAEKYHPSSAEARKLLRDGSRDFAQERAPDHTPASHPASLMFSPESKRTGTERSQYCCGIASCFSYIT